MVFKISVFLIFYLLKCAFFLGYNYFINLNLTALEEFLDFIIEKWYWWFFEEGLVGSANFYYFPLKFFMFFIKLFYILIFLNNSFVYKIFFLIKMLGFIYGSYCILNIVFLSFFSFLILFFFSKFIVFECLILFIFLNFLLQFFFLINVYFFFINVNGLFFLMVDYYILNFYYFNIEWSFICDHITLIMFFVVLLISFFVHLYSIIYMRYDPHLLRFLSLLSLFTFAMLILVSSGNLLLIFFGWEGVGICSYLLVNFWFTRIQANKSAIKAMLVNRIGDVSLLIFLSLIFYIFRTFDYCILLVLYKSYIYSYINFYFFYVHLYSFLTFWLLLAAVGKSAQLGLHTWLPDAMEGPTPVSALIHAATMVTAGVFILIRFYFFIEFSFIKSFIFLFGALTALFGSIVASSQYDIKKVIAYSTCSQLGYMVVACALGQYNLALFHLFNHAFFKALLLLSAGVILHSLLDEQDMRKMGGLFRLLPITYICLFFASYSLMGLPFLSGFFSKDIILEINFLSYNFISYFSFLLILFSAFFTAFYSFRLIFFVFYQNPKGFFTSYIKVHEAHYFMLFGFFFLFFFSVSSGYFFSNFFTGLGSLFIKTNLVTLSYNNMFDYELVFFGYKLLPFCFSLFGLFFGYIMYLNNIFIFFYLNKFYKFIFDFLNYKWYFDLLYNKIFLKISLDISHYITYKLIDKNFLELFGVNIFSFFFYKLSYYYKNIYSTFLYTYVFLLFIGFIFIICIYYIGPNIIILFFFNIIYYILYFFFKKN